MKILIFLGTVFIVVGLGYLYLVAPVLAITLIVITVTLAVFYGSLLGGIYAYHKLGQAKLANAQAWAVKVEAAKISNSVQAVMLPAKTNLQISVLPARSITMLESANTGAAPALVAPSNEPQGLPQAPAFSQLLEEGFQPTVERMLMGYNHNGPLYGSIDALLSTGVAGRPGQGKSSLLRFVYAQVAMLPGGMLFTLDPHGSITEDIGGGPGLAFDAGTAKEFDDAAIWIITELDRRLAAYRSGHRNFKPVMGLIDEMPVVSLASTNAKAAIGRVILEGRKVKMYSLISGQGLTADQFGGSLFRDALSSRYIFKTTDSQARYAGLEKDARKLVESLERGRAVFDGPMLDKPGIVAVPFVTGDDLMRLAATFRQPASGTTTGNAQQTAPGRASFNNNNNGYGYSNEQNYAAPQPAPAPRTTPKPQSNATTVTATVAPATVEHVADHDTIVTAEYRELPPRPDQLEQARRAWYDGASSVRKLAAALDCNEWTARKLVEQLRDKGLISTLK